MSFTLPRSLDKRLHSVEHEVAFARSLTPEERLEVVASVCRSALGVLNMHSRRDHVLQHRDPMPESTLRALERLRERA